MQTNEIFLLAGAKVTRIMAVWQRNGNDLKAAMAPYVDFVGGQWWDVVKGATAESDIGFGKKDTKAAKEAAKLERELKTMTNKSLSYLKAALLPTLPAPLHSLLTIEFYSKCDIMTVTTTPVWYV